MLFSRRRALATLLLVGAASHAAAQQATPSLPELKSLRVSAPPAFVLLGVSPTSVDRPGTPTDLGLQLANRTGFFQELPSDFALETSPYWLVGHPRLSWRRDERRSVWESVQRTFSISAAGAEVGDSVHPRTGVGAGVRLLPLSGHLSAATVKALREAEQHLRRQDSIFLARAHARLDSLDAATGALLASVAAIQDPEARRAAQQAVAAQHQRARSAIEDAILSDSAYQRTIAAEREKEGIPVVQREGVLLELAAATVWDFPNAVAARGRYARSAGWAAFSYEGPRVTPVLLVRYQGQAGDTLPNLLDAGTRLVFDGAHWGASLEGVWRHPLSESFADLYRVAGMFEYEVVPQLWVIGTFGRDYQTQRSGSLIAQLGLKLNVNRERYAAQ